MFKVHGLTCNNDANHRITSEVETVELELMPPLGITPEGWAYGRARVRRTRKGR